MKKNTNQCWGVIVALLTEDPDKDELLKGLIYDLAENPVPEISNSLLRLYKDDIITITSGYALQLPDPKPDQVLVNEVLEVLKDRMKLSGM